MLPCRYCNSERIVKKSDKTEKTVNKVESYIVTSLTIYQDLLKSEIDKRIISQKHLSFHQPQQQQQKKANKYYIRA